MECFNHLECETEQLELLHNKMLNQFSNKINLQEEAVECAKNCKLTVASMFSGCGGMDLGFTGNFNFLGKYYSALPYNIIWANELNEKACETYRKNFEHDIICADVWDAISTMPRSVDMLIGGFPCQDISVNGKMAGINGSRSNLYKAMVEGVRRSHPKIFIAENVKGLLMKNHKELLSQVVHDFSSLGYQVSYKLYHAADFGVPQTRDRVFIVGVNDEVNSFIPPVPTNTKENFVSAEHAIADLEHMKEDSSFNHIWSKANKSPDQGNRRLIAERPGYTIRAECHGNIQYHYKLNRRISMREAARIQSFPDNFLFASKLRETERQIGNAVPPVLAWHIAKAALFCFK